MGQPCEDDISDGLACFYLFNDEVTDVGGGQRFLMAFWLPGEQIWAVFWRVLELHSNG
ncbi:hypothetical protein P9578_03405 [Brevibacillus choshinensis]|uniref:hypothetical protein n=1 Tax=Brevibacillus choshinensis TaxID=54911 RepID=UPI002E24C680|nr:hypothetical protein [Brevibacillus choshinensis]